MYFLPIIRPWRMLISRYEIKRKFTLIISLLTSLVNRRVFGYLSRLYSSVSLKLGKGSARCPPPEDHPHCRYLHSSYCFLFVAVGAAVAKPEHVSILLEQTTAEDRSPDFSALQAACGTCLHRHRQYPRYHHSSLASTLGPLQ